MKKYALMVMGLGLAFASPVLAEEAAKTATTPQQMRVCKTHCDIMKLEDEINALKSQANSANKTAEKEALKKKVDSYQKMLDELKKKLEAE